MATNMETAWGIDQLIKLKKVAELMDFMVRSFILC